MNTDRVKRLLILIRTLETGRSWSVKELADRAQVSRRTVFRDLALLAKAGIDYAYDHETKRYTAEGTTLMPPVTLSHAESLALLLAARSLLGDAKLPGADAVASAGLKLESMLPSSIRDHCGPIVDRMDVRRNPSSDSESIGDTMAILQDSLSGNFELEVSYDSYKERRVVQSVLHPYRLAFLNRGWYLIAYAKDVDRVQTYKVERMLSLRRLESTFDPDPKFNLVDYFGNAWSMIRGEESFDVKIRFKKMVAGNVDEILWHRTQQTTFQEDGSLIFEVTVDGIEEISWWVLGYGDQAEVIEPPELRAIIGVRVARMNKFYNSAAHIQQAAQKV